MRISGCILEISSGKICRTPVTVKVVESDSALLRCENYEPLSIGENLLPHVAVLARYFHAIVVLFQVELSLSSSYVCQH